MGELIGPNDCDVPLDDIQLSCSVRYRGNKPPQLEWRRHGEAIEVFESKCTTEDNSLTVCSTTVKPDLTMNGSYFVCQTTKRAAKEQYNCTANVTVLCKYCVHVHVAACSRQMTLISYNSQALASEFPDLSNFDQVYTMDCDFLL